MVKTYQVLDSDGKVLEYFHRQGDAMEFMVKFFDRAKTLRLIVGPYYGEGYHKYEMELTSNCKFRFTMRR